MLIFCDIVQGFELVVGDGGQESFYGFGFHRDGDQGVFKSHESGKAFKGAVSIAIINGRDRSVNAVELFFGICFPMICGYIWEFYDGSPVADRLFIQEKISWFREGCPATGVRGDPCHAKTVFAAASGALLRS